MNLVRREGFVTALRQGILWYSTAQQEHSPEAAEVLAQRFADAVDHTIDKLLRRPGAGVVWPHRQGYRCSLVKKPFERWLIFCRLPDPITIELVDIIRGERDLPRRVK
jgi:plasmid stabilization system protein ParE